LLVEMQDGKGGGLGIGDEEEPARGFKNNVVEDRPTVGWRQELDILQEDGLGIPLLAQLPQAQLRVVLAAGYEQLAVWMIDDTPRSQSGMPYGEYRGHRRKEGQRETKGSEENALVGRQ